MDSLPHLTGVCQKAYLALWESWPLDLYFPPRLKAVVCSWWMWEWTEELAELVSRSLAKLTLDRTYGPTTPWLSGACGKAMTGPYHLTTRHLFE